MSASFLASSVDCRKTKREKNDWDPAIPTSTPGGEEEIPESDFAPGESEVQIYYRNDGEGRYIELESQERYTALAPGERLDWTVKWYADTIPDDIIVEYGSSELVALARSMVR